MAFATLAFLGAFGADQGLLTYFADLSGPGWPYIAFHNNRGACQMVGGWSRAVSITSSGDADIRCWPVDSACSRLGSSFSQLAMFSRLLPACLTRRKAVS